MAAARGTATHNSAEYLLKTTLKLARATAQKRNSWKMGEDGLLRAPKAVTKWAMEKALQGAPPVPWSATGYARGLRGWILDHVTAVHAIEFSAFHPAGFAGACDALVDLDGEGPFIVDWKTTQKSIHKSNESQLHNYRHQTGAYSLMLNYRTGIQALGGAVVVARRTGDPSVERLDLDALKKAERSAQRTTSWTSLCDTFLPVALCKPCSLPWSVWLPPAEGKESFCPKIFSS